MRTPLLGWVPPLGRGLLMQKIGRELLKAECSAALWWPCHR
jgi:hypothetical protein